MMFMKHLKSIYMPDDSSIHFEIKAGTGGAPVSVVQGALKVAGSFDARIAKFDNDMGKKALSAAHQKKDNIKAIYCTPAIEATLLEILEPGKNYKNHSTQNCKKRLHAKYMPEVDRMNLQKYNDIFEIGMLNEARARHTRLNHLIEIFELGIHWQGYSEGQE